MGRKSTITQPVRDFILDYLSHPNGHGKLTAEKLYNASGKDHELTAELKAKGLPRPGKAAFIKVYGETREELSKTPPSPLDAPWSVGVCLQYGILARCIPTLLVIKLLHSSGVVTIRMARWFAYLYPQLEPELSKRFPNPKNVWGYIAMIAEMYAKRERIALLRGKDVPDTSDLDELYFIKKDFDVIEGWFNTSDIEIDKEGIGKEYRDWKKESEQK